MEIVTPRLILREYRLEDFAAVREYSLDREIHRYESEVIPDDLAVRTYLQNAIDWAQERPRTRYWLAVTVQPLDCAVGRISLTRLYESLKQWEIGWVIRRELWGQGYATEAAQAMLGFAFETIRAHKIVAFCNARNTASYQVMEKIGMQREGTLRDGLWWNGGWCDELVYAILEGEYPAGLG